MEARDQTRAKYRNVVLEKNKSLIVDEYTIVKTEDYFYFCFIL